MKRITFIYILLTLIFAISGNPARADKEGLPELTKTFDLNSINKKGVLLSELGLLPQGAKDKLIRYQDAMRVEETYSPTPDTRPFNLPLEQVQKHVDRAHASLKSVMDNEMFVTALKGKDIELPVGIKKTIGNSTVVICIDSLVFTPRYAYAVIYTIIEDKKNNKKLAFVGRDIRFTKDGGFTGDARLELLQTYTLAFGNNIDVKFLVDATHENYVVFNCDGFQRLHVDAKVIFSRNLFLPEKADGTIDPNLNNKVSTGFTTDFVSFDNWLVQLSNIPYFQVRGLEGCSFSLQTLTFDYSSVENPTGIVFPANYDYPGFAPGVSQDLWEGFYISNLVVRLPKEFKLKNNATRRIEMAMEKGIIDKLGFTGALAVRNLLAMGDAKMVSWDYSVDTVRISLLKSTPVGATVAGRLKVPVTKDNEVFKFSAQILPNNQYNFVVRNETVLNFPLWGMGQVDLYRDSYIRVDIQNGEFKPTALLSGICKIGADVNGPPKTNDSDNEDKSLTLASVTFQKILVTVDAPYLDVAPGGGISVGGSSPRMSKMPLCINQIGIVKGESGRIGILIDCKINLLGPNDPGTFAAGAKLRIWGERNTTSNRWEYYKTELDKLYINVNLNAVVVKGYIEFFRDDAVYGNGFAGGISLKMTTLDSLGMECNVMFGKKKRAASDDIFRYWYVDANVNFGTARIPLFPSLFANAVGLGAYYGVEPVSNPPPGTRFVMKNGVGYIPKESAGLGLKAMLGVEGPSKKVFNGELGLEISFATSGRLEYIIFSGFVQCADFQGASGLVNMAEKYKQLQEKTKVQSLLSQKDTPTQPTEVNNEIAQKSGGAIMVKWKMEYDNNLKQFTADLDLYVNVAGVINGVNGNNKAGSLNIFISKNKWYFRLGVPRQPMGISVVDIASATMYFVAGHDLPAPEPMPNGRSSDFTSTVKGDAGLGKGFGFGARISVRAQIGGALYAYIDGGLGADIFLFNEGPVYCRSTGRNRGIKDWYAFGQVYVYVEAGVGINVCIPFFRPTCKCCRICPRLCCWERYDICARKEWSARVGLGAQFEGVRPFWGSVYVENPVKSFSIDVGKKCN